MANNSFQGSVIDKHRANIAPPQSLSLAQFRDRVRAGSGIIFDLRAKEDFQTAHVPGALSFPSDYFEGSYVTFRSQLERNKAQPIAVYCAGVSCDAGDRVGRRLAERGYTDVAVFHGGWEAWHAAGLPEADGK